MNWNNTARPVLRLDRDSGEILETYASRHQASKLFGRNPNTTYGSITDVCKGRQKSAYGFNWKYAEQNEVEK